MPFTRILRVFVSFGIFIEQSDRQFQNSELSETLRRDAPGSVRNYARWLGTDFRWRMVSALDYTVRSGNPAHFRDQPSKTAFEFLAQDRSAQQTFNDASDLSLLDGAAIVQAYDFSPFGRIIDVGGRHSVGHV
jgi:C-methyltransferase